MKGTDNAFPAEGHVADSGLTKREYLAAMAMQGLVNSPDIGHVSDVARYAVSIADALIQELSK